MTWGGTIRQAVSRAYAPVRAFAPVVFAPVVAASVLAGALGVSAAAQNQQLQPKNFAPAPASEQQQRKNTAETPTRLPLSQQHLASWLDLHRNLTPPEQQKALEHEQGFNQLKPETQQRIRERLNELNSMTPLQRQRTIDRTEAMERLNGTQRQEVRGAMAQLGALPEERRRFVARTFHSLRALPPAQQQDYLNSATAREQFSPNERLTLSNLFRVAPYLPIPQNRASVQVPPPQ